jgi:hypothetical protein
MNLVRTDARSEVSILVPSPEFDRNKKSTTDYLWPGITNPKAVNSVYMIRL